MPMREKVEQNSSVIDPWYEHELVCPRDKSNLKTEGTELVCAAEHRYPIADGIPVMLYMEDNVTMPKAFAHSLALAEQTSCREHNSGSGSPDAVDPWVRRNLTTTCGKRLFGRAEARITSYPVPRIPLARALHPGQELLDIGCNWGRWSIAASRLGYVPVGIDPMLEAVFAARRVAKQLGFEAHFVCGDARHLPFRDGRFEIVHSYGVFQHFSKSNAISAIGEAGRVLSPGGTALVQMTAAFGPLALCRRAKYAIGLGFGDPGGFEVRHWTPGEMKAIFRRFIGPTSLSVDGYFTILPEPGDLKLLDPKHRALIRFSAVGRAFSRILPPLLNVADSLYASSSKPKH